MNDIVQVAPGKLGPYGTTELAPGIFAPTPNTLFPEPRWSPPQAGELVLGTWMMSRMSTAPWGYTEYLPGITTTTWSL
jgi:hypothetical protein